MGPSTCRIATSWFAMGAMSRSRSRKGAVFTAARTPVTSTSVLSALGAPEVTLSKSAQATPAFAFLSAIAAKTASTRPSRLRAAQSVLIRCVAPAYPTSERDLISLD